MASTLDIIHRHQQLYQNSCPAMAVELVLKIERQVGGGYRKLQDNYREPGVGYAPFRDRPIRNLYFTQRSFDPPYRGLLLLLQNEWKENRTPIIGLLDHVTGDTGWIHEGVVIARESDDFVVVSKNRAQTVWA